MPSAKTQIPEGLHIRGRPREEGKKERKRKKKKEKEKERKRMDKVERALLNLPKDRLINSASRVMSTAQNLKPHEAIGALSSSFLLLCHNFNVSPRKALEVAERALRDARKTERGDVQIGAIDDLMKRELSE